MTDVHCRCHARRVGGCNKGGESSESNTHPMFFETPHIQLSHITIANLPHRVNIWWKPHGIIPIQFNRCWPRGTPLEVSIWMRPIFPWRRSKGLLIVALSVSVFGPNERTIFFKVRFGHWLLQWRYYVLHAAVWHHFPGKSLQIES